MASSCNICCEYYNKSTRSAIRCCYDDCNFEACKTCVRTYLLSTTNDPHCMNCKKAWSQDFMTMNLNRSFVSQEYKAKRMDLLLEKEMSKMPQTMEAAEREKAIGLQKQILEKIDTEIVALQLKMKELSQKKRETREEILYLRNNSTNTPSSEKRKFIMPCPGNDCRGFLSSQYKCGLCNMHTCSKCLVIIGPDKNGEHVCNEDMVKSAELIKQETKPCPSCGTRISKISGCNQMWCTNCNVAFSWSSGVIDNGPVHNPHFYEYQKTLDSNGVAPRNPGDVVCGGMCNYITLRNIIKYKIVSQMSTNEDLKRDHEIIEKNMNDIYSLHQVGLHISHVCLPKYREQARDIDHNESLRVQYILKGKTKEELRSSIYQKDYTRQKNKDVLYIFELIGVSLIEMFAQIVTSKNEGVEFTEELNTHLQLFENLASYCNEQLETISVSYNRSVPRIIYSPMVHYNSKKTNYEWVIIFHKYCSYSKKKKNYKQNATVSNGAASED